IKGSPPAVQVGGDFVPTIPTWIGPESIFHQGWETFANLSAVAGVAAQTGFVQLRNPAGSNVVAVITKAFITSGLADNPAAAIGPGVAQGSVLTNVRFDPRGRTDSSLIFSSGAGANPFSGLGTIFQVLLAASSPPDLEVMLFEDHDIALLPGFAFLL